MTKPAFGAMLGAITEVQFTSKPEDTIETSERHSINIAPEVAVTVLGEGIVGPSASSNNIPVFEVPSYILRKSKPDSVENETTFNVMLVAQLGCTKSEQSSFTR